MTSVLAGVLIAAASIGCSTGGSSGNAHIEMPARRAAPPPILEQVPNKATAAIHTYLFTHFLRSDWLGSIHAILFRDHTVTVKTSLPAGNRGRNLALEACDAVLHSNRSPKVRVYYGSSSIVAC